MFEDVLKSMKKRRLVLGFLFIQLLLDYSLILQSWILIAKADYADRIFSEYSSIDPGTTYSYSSMVDISKANLSTHYTQIRNQMDQLVQSGVIHGFGNSDKAEIIVQEAEKRDQWLSMLAKLFGDNPYRMEGILTDYGVYEQMKTSIGSGRALEPKDFELSATQEIPVLVGVHLESVFPLGSAFSIRGSSIDEGLPARVVGVLNGGNQWINENFSLGRFEDLDYRMVIPHTKSIQQSAPFLATQGIFTASGDPNTVVSQISRVFSEGGAPINIKNLEQEFSRKREEERQSLLEQSLFAGLMVLVAVSGIVSTTLSSLTQQKYELGIRMSAGYSKSRIQKMVLLELLALNIGAMLLSYGVRYFWEGRTAISDLFSVFPVLTDPITILGVLLTMAGILAISMLFPSVAIGRFAIVDLIRRGE